MGSGDGEFSSLADTIAAVCRELGSAQAAGRGQPVQFRAGPVELESDVAVTRTGGAEGGVQVWVLTLGGRLGRGHATTQRIKVTPHPVDPGTGQDAQIADTIQGPGTGRAAVAEAGARGIWGPGDSIGLARKEGGVGG